MDQIRMTEEALQRIAEEGCWWEGLKKWVAYICFSLEFHLGFGWNNSKGRRVAQRVVDKELARRAARFKELCTAEDALLVNYQKPSELDLERENPERDLARLTREIPSLERARRKFEGGYERAKAMGFVVHALGAYTAPRPPKPPLPF